MLWIILINYTKTNLMFKTMIDNSHMNQGNVKLKPDEKIYKINPDKDKGTRKVQINSTTWVYTKCETDQEAIEKFNRLHKLHDERML